MKFPVLAILCLLFLFRPSTAQTTQTVKGRIIDNASKSPVPGANVLIEGSDPILGSATDESGNFRIEKVLLGRINLVITCIGYEPRVIRNIQVGAGKEVMVTMGITESLTALDEVIITSRKNNSEVSNEMVQVSGRAFSVEETKRYAGAFNDPARMVTSFAGVQGSADGNNLIIVRGNSPNTVQWRVDGSEIPNPNHFAEEGASGGAINMLSSTMLANSDFYTGAFTADYGNVLGAVFDMKLRTGNMDTHEYSMGVGILGTDVTLEGPFVSGKKASYLVNYRYSTLSLLDKAGLIDFGGVPKYQDISFKLSFPTHKAGLFTLTGIGGLSSIHDETEDEETAQLIDRSQFSTSLGTTTLNHVYFFDQETSLESFVSFSQNGSKDRFDELRHANPELLRVYNDKLEKQALRAGTTINYKLNARNTVRTGLRVEHSTFTFHEEFLNSGDVWETWLNDSGNAALTRAFTSWNHRLDDQWSFTAGINFQYLDLSKQSVLEPRGSVKYQIDDKSSVFAGIGMHSQMTTLPAYYSLENGTRTNLDLDFMKAVHWIAGYDRKLGPNVYLKSEAYYQWLYKIPVEDDVNSSFSMLNAVDGLVHESLVNEGTGKNYGIELTLERYFSGSYYFMFTNSLFDSRYTALDGVERNTMFNTTYTTNFLFGKEFSVGRKPEAQKMISVNSRLNLAGGSPLRKVDLTSSREEGRTVYFDMDAYSTRGKAFMRLDLSVAYSWNGRKTRQEIKFDVQNLTNNQAELYEYYSSFDDKIEKGTQLGLFPVIAYQLEF